MSDKANPLALYHQRQIENQAQPVTPFGPDGGPAQFQLSGSNVTPEGHLLTRAVGSDVTDAVYLLNNAKTADPGAWVETKGMNRAVFLIQTQTDASELSPGNSLRVEGRVDGQVMTLPVHYFNTGIVTNRATFTGYYEMGINPLHSIRVVPSFPQSDGITVRMWMSGTTFIPGVASATVALVNARAFTTTAHYDTPLLSGIGFSRLRLLALSTLDEPVDVLLMTTAPSLGGLHWHNPVGAPTVQQVTIPGGAARRTLITEAHLPALGGPLAELFNFRVTPQEAPTTGSLTLLATFQPT